MHRTWKPYPTARRTCRDLSFLVLLFLAVTAHAQQTETPEQKIERLSWAMDQAQQQLLVMQQQLADLRRQLAEVKPENPATTADAAAPAAGESSSAAMEEIRERTAIAESQIAVHERTKVETDSKYPLTVSGLLLFNGFVNTHRVDVPASPAYAQSGGGSTGFSIRQTILGLDARGPHLWGAESYADLRVDFYGNGATPNLSPTGVLRLRTAHAGLQWKNTEIFAELDHTLLAPNVPSSLVAMAQPELSWSGFLWSWNPQIGLTQRLPFSESRRLKLQAALMDEGDPEVPNIGTVKTGATQTERSRWPATEARIAYETGERGRGMEIGIGGYFGPHKTQSGVRFNGWAATADLRLPMSRYFEFIANAYRGQALGGLGGGGYANTYQQYVGGQGYTRPLDDVGGFAQLKSKFGQKVEFNTGFGIDNPFAKQIHQHVRTPGADSYVGLTRNRTYYGNVIYGPSRYLLFSLEYRKMFTNYANGPTYPADVIGLGVGYKF